MTVATTIQDPAAAVAADAAPADANEQGKSTTFVVFSDQLDKQLMAFTLANASAASGMKTTIFFAFWGVAALRKSRKSRGKNLIERMFGRMLPLGVGALPMSKMHFMGMGRWLMRRRMRSLGIASLDEQVQAAEALGVRFVACETSMGMMGFRREELRESAEVGGAASCLAEAVDANVSMVV